MRTSYSPTPNGATLSKSPAFAGSHGCQAVGAPQTACFARWAGAGNTKLWAAILLEGLGGRGGEARGQLFPDVLGALLQIGVADGAIKIHGGLFHSLKSLKVQGAKVRKI